jgi:hypothetical protein
MRTIVIFSAMLFAATTLMPLPVVAASAVTSDYSLTLSAQQRAPSPACERDRKACMAGSARTGHFGARYVPPEAVRMCMDAYRACIGRR